MITDDDRIIKVNIEEEMKSSYIDHSSEGHRLTRRQNPAC